MNQVILQILLLRDCRNAIYLLSLLIEDINQRRGFSRNGGLHTIRKASVIFVQMEQNLSIEQQREMGIMNINWNLSFMQLVLCTR